MNLQMLVTNLDLDNMKRLQCNFTTPEQSKRLLELGVPADSADLFYSKFECETFGNRPTLCYDKKYSDIVPYGYENDYLPCWSVGRLIEILEIILGSPWSDKELLGEQGTLLERVVSDFEDVVRYKEVFKDNRIDFSKLEE